MKSAKKTRASNQECCMHLTGLMHHSCVMTAPAVNNTNLAMSAISAWSHRKGSCRGTADRLHCHLSRINSAFGRHVYGIHLYFEWEHIFKHTQTQILPSGHLAAWSCDGWPEDSFWLEFTTLCSIQHHSLWKHASLSVQMLQNGCKGLQTNKGRSAFFWVPDAAYKHTVHRSLCI